jgi:hypothetical protein
MQIQGFYQLALSIHALCPSEPTQLYNSRALNQLPNAAQNTLSQPLKHKKPPPLLQAAGVLRL